MTLAQWDTVFSVNAAGQLLCAKKFVREFKRPGFVPESSRCAGMIFGMISVRELIYEPHSIYIDNPPR